MNTQHTAGHIGQHTAAPAAKSAPPARPVTPLDLMRQSSESLARTLRPNPSLQPAIPGQPATQKPHEVDLTGLLQVVKDCASVPAGVGVFLQTINELGQRTPERNVRSAAVMLPLALYDVHNRRAAGREGQPVRLSQQEELLLKVYAASQDGNLPIPEWFWPGYPFVQLTSRMENLPSIDVYLRESKALASTAAPLLERFDDLTRRHLEALGKADRFTEEENTAKSTGKVALRGADAGAAERQRATQLETERGKVEREMLGLVDRIRDVRPELMDSVCAEVQLSAALKPDYVRATLEATKGVAEILAYALDPEFRAKKPSNTITLPQILVKDHNASIATLRLSANALKNGLAPEQIAELLQTYCALRNSVITNFDLLQTAHQPELKRLRAEIEPQLARLFPLDAENGKNVLSAVLSHTTPAVQNAAVELLTSRVRIQESIGGGKNGTIFESPENIQFLSWAVEILLRGDAGAAEKVRASLQHSSMQPVVNFTDSVRIAIKKGDVIGVAVTIDDEIRVCKELGTSAPYGRLAALMLAMVAVSHEDQLRRNVKSVLQRLDDVTEIARSLTSKISEKDKKAATFIENCRGDIVRLFSVDLADYWGYKKIVDEFKELLENHILLLKSPQAWRGLNPSDVFLNGHLLFGPPGAGKTFLVQCMANTLGTPLVRVSREEISSAYGEARAEGKFYSETKSLASKSEERMETKITEFIRKKIADADAAMRKSEKHACILFFDEIEGEMVEREVVKNSPDQIALTNAMLRVLEREMSKHPEVIFVAATNHIELVDQAALRPGRFGIHHSIKGPSPEDVATIVQRTLDLLGTKFDKDGDPEFKKLCEDAVGLNPLPIKLAILNRLCVARAVALADGKEDYCVPLPELSKAMLQMKRLSARPIDYEKPNLERDVHGILNSIKELSAVLGALAQVAEKNRSGSPTSATTASA